MIKYSSGLSFNERNLLLRDNSTRNKFRALGVLSRNFANYQRNLEQNYKNNGVAHGLYNAGYAVIV